MVRGVMVACATLIAAAAISACGSEVSGGGAAGGGSSDGKKLDVGNGTSIPVGNGQLKIAFFSGAANNQYLQAGIRAAKEEAKRVGAQMTVFDGQFDVARQSNQVQSAITSGKYNAFVAEANDPQQMCKIFSETAPKAGILVSVINGPLCARATKSGDEVWQPGTVNFVGGTQTRDAFTNWLEKIAEENPGPQQVAVLIGPVLGANSQNTKLAVQAVTKKHPDFKVIAVTETDYSLPDGQAKAQNLLQAHKDLTLLVSNYSDVTRGALQSVKAAGRLGKVKVYDYGSNKWAVQAVKQGDLAMTGVMLPYTEVADAVKSLAAAWKGEQVPHFDDLAKADAAPKGGLIISRENVDQFTPEY
jgi:ribose transport system substrate-binding protein